MSLLLFVWGMIFVTPVILPNEWSPLVAVVVGSILICTKNRDLEPLWSGIIAIVVMLIMPLKPGLYAVWKMSAVTHLGLLLFAWMLRLLFLDEPQPRPNPRRGRGLDDVIFTDPDPHGRDAVPVPKAGHPLLGGASGPDETDWPIVAPAQTRPSREVDRYNEIMFPERPREMPEAPIEVERGIPVELPPRKHPAGR